VAWLNWLFEGLSSVGRLGLVWVAVALMLAVLWRRPSVFVLVVAADAIADLAATALKDVIPRHRPRLPTLGIAPHDHSFPSGHAATSFACASMLSALSPRLRLPAYALAVLIAFSRLYNGVHYPLDVLGGAVLGLVVTSLLLRAARRRGSPRGSRAG
jgi:undecaprenyl-diphosphatase